MRENSARDGRRAGAAPDVARLVRTLAEDFIPDDPDYEPNDSAMGRIHCRI